MERFFYLFEVETSEGWFVLALDKCDKYGAMPAHIRRRGDKTFMTEEETQRAYTAYNGDRHTAFDYPFSLEGSMFLARQPAAYNTKTCRYANDFLGFCISLYNLARGVDNFNWRKFRLYHSRLIWHPNSIWDIVKHGRNKFFKKAQL